MKRRLLQVCGPMFYRYILYSIFALSSVVLALSLSWVLLLNTNFLYPIWHDVGGIGAGIDHFGPKNRFKPGFGESTKEDRSRIFAEINDAVHANGQGLADIRYQTPSSNGSQAFLHHDEIVHLQDVAKLINLLKIVSLANFLTWLALAGTFIVLFRALPPLSTQYLGLAVILTISLLVLFSIGPGKVFDQLHIWIFPKENKWFFYYQESLMSTLMMAPKLFGWIAASMALLTVISFGAITYSIHRLSQRLF